MIGQTGDDTATSNYVSALKQGKGGNKFYQ